MALIPPRRLQLLQIQIQLRRQATNALALAQLIQYNRRLKKMRRAFILVWINRRAEFGFYGLLMTELEAESEADFNNLLRMEPAMFRELFERVAPRITKQDTNYKKVLEPGLKLAITLRHLAAG